MADVINNRISENLKLKMFKEHAFLHGHADYDHARFRCSYGIYLFV